MANRVFIIPRRMDFSGMCVQVLDLFPNTSQKNSNLDGQGQTHYLGPCLDYPGTTTTRGDSYAGGSLNTLLATVPDAVANMDTTGGGDDVDATPTATFGLAAYIRDRVQSGVPGGAGASITVANANLMANAIKARVDAGSALTLAGINTALQTVTALTELRSDTTGSICFGQVSDILRILAGEIYCCPRYTIVATQAHAWQTLAQRLVLVAAQLTNVTGLTFQPSGNFLSSTMSGYRYLPLLARTGEMNGSIVAGYLSKYGQEMTFLNPAFAYAAADVTDEHLRAYDIAGVAIPSTGIKEGVRVYDSTGNCLL